MAATGARSGLLRSGASDPRLQVHHGLIPRTVSEGSGTLQTVDFEHRLLTRGARKARRQAAFGLLLAIYLAARFLQVYPCGVPMTAVVGLHVLPPAAFALLHGARVYGWRGMLVFVSICMVVGNLFENVGVRTGFPYGRYYFTDLMGPKLWVVPVLLGLAYIGMAYLSWTLARIILGQPQGPLRGSRAILVPLTAACLMVSWDVSQDPVWATVLHAWIFPGGGPFFGVPVSNFAGWYLTISIIYFSFATYLRGGAASARDLPHSYWRQALTFYTASAAGNLLPVLPRKDIPAVVYAGGTPWNVHAITVACAVVTVFTMGTFALLGWARLADSARAVNLARDPAYQWDRENQNR
jgi:uncharacterized membrane protein